MNLPPDLALVVYLVVCDNGHRFTVAAEEWADASCPICDSRVFEVQ